MALDWLYGPGVIRVTDTQLEFGSSYRLSISDVQEIGRALGQVCARVEFRRGEFNSVYRYFTPSSDPARVEEMSDTDLGALFVQGYLTDLPSSEQAWAYQIHIGRKAAARVSANVLSVANGQPVPHDPPATEALLTRVAAIIVGSRRRIPPWRMLAWLRVGVVVALCAVVIGVLVTQWRNPALVATAVLAAIAFGWQAKGWMDTWSQRAPRYLNAKRGHVAIDPRDHDKIRNDRANSHQNWKVAGLTLAGSLLVAFVAWALDLISIGRPGR